MQSSEIARRLGYMTSRAVRNRLQKLRNEGYVAITAGAVPEKLGFAISADIAIDVEPGMTQLVAQSLVELDEVYYVALTTGDTDVSASVVVVNMGIYRLSSATNCIRSRACARRGLVCSPRCSSRAATGPFRKTFLNFEPLARSVARPRLEIGYGHNQATLASAPVREAFNTRSTSSRLPTSCSWVTPSHVQATGVVGQIMRGK